MNLFVAAKRKIAPLFGLNKLESSFDLLSVSRQIGGNWNRKETSEKPIAILYGFDNWEQQNVSMFLPNYRTAFISKKIPFRLVAENIDQVGNTPVFTRMYSRSDKIGKLAKKNGIKLIRVEDGFIRSNGSRIDRKLPLSMIFDSSGGIYFDSSKPSQLENLLNDYKFNDALIKNAEQGIKKVIDANVGRYGIGDTSITSLFYGEKTKKRILIAGQAEDYKYKTFCGASEKYTNNDLVKLAYEENPNAELIYKVHPEVASGHRKMISNPNEVSDICTLIWDKASVNDVLSDVDQVYTFSSLLGFEALLRDIKVTVLGQPFYAGWGLTDDRIPMKRRSRMLSKEEIFAAAYLLYPSYIEEKPGVPLTIPKTVDLLCAENASFDLKLTEIGSSSDPWPTMVSILIETGSLSSAIKLVPHYLENIDESSSISKTAATAIAKYCLSIFTRENDPQRAIAEIDRVPFNEIIQHEILLNICAYLYLEASAFDRLQSLFKEALNFHEVSLDGDSLSVDKILSLSIFISLLYNIDQFLFSFGRFSLGVEQSKSLERLIEKIFNLHPEQSQAIRSAIETLGERYATFALHQDQMSSIEVIDKFLKNPSVNSRTTRIICSILLNNSITREEQMQYRIDVSRTHLKEMARGFRITKRFTTDSLKTLTENVEICKGLGEKDLLKLYNERIVDFLSQPANHQTAQRKRSLINKLIEIYSLSENASVELLEKALSFTSSWHESDKSSGVFLKLHCRLLSMLNKHQEFLDAFSVITSFHNDYVFAMNCSDYFMRLDRFDQGIECAEKAVSILENVVFDRPDNPKLIALHKRYRSNLGLKKFYKESADILAKYPQPKQVKGVVFVTPYDHQNTMAMTIPLLCELRSRGYATVYLGQGVLPFESTGNPDIDKFHGIVGNSYDHLNEELYANKRMFNEWNLDWQNKKLSTNGVNYYQGVFEYLANRYRRFRIKLDNPIIYKFYETQHHKIDRAVEICERIYKDVASKGIPVNFLGVSAQTSPTYTFKEFCAHKGKQAKMHFYFALNGYENYYSNLGTRIAGTMALADMTINYDRRSPLIADRKDFDSWIDNGNELINFKDEVKGWLNKNRVNKQSTTPEAEAVWQKVLDHKARKRKVIVVYGKVLCDLGVPYDGGPAHRDMYDWINHTVESARQGNALILIKPHPHEKRPEIARHLTEYLFDLIEGDVPDNVVLMDNSWFNNNEITRVMDLGVLWNGTSCLELGSAGLPVVMCAYHGKFDYPVDFYYPDDRDDYREIIQGNKDILPTDGNDVRCQLLLKYLSTDSTAIKYRYALRPATNDPVGSPHWFEEDLGAFFEGKDSNISKLADRFFVYNS